MVGLGSSEKAREPAELKGYMLKGTLLQVGHLNRLYKSEEGGSELGHLGLISGNFPSKGSFNLLQISVQGRRDDRRII